MLKNSDLAHFAGAFGVADSQILKDHVISHVLSVLPTMLSADWAFFGGTALCRTYLKGRRLSEDIDLLCLDCDSLLDELSKRLPKALHREFPASRLDLGVEEGIGRQ